MSNVISLSNFTKATFDKNRLVLQDSVTLDEWKELGQNLKQVEGSVQFWIGDWARFGEKMGFTGKYTDSKVYDELEKITGLNRETLKEYRSVAERTSQVRTCDLDYSHHRAVASLPEDKQRLYLDRAKDEGLSVKALRGEINKYEVPEVAPEPKDEKREAMLSAQRIGEKMEMETVVKELLSKINALPKLYRLKIKQGIK